MALGLISDAFSITKWAIKLCMGIHRLVQEDEEISDLSDLIKDLTSDQSDISRDIRGIQADIKKVLDNQASTVALIKEGHDDICERLISLESTVNQGFRSVITTIDNSDARKCAREYKEKVTFVMLAYDVLLKNVDEAIKCKRQQSQSLFGNWSWQFSFFASSKRQGFPSLARNDVQDNANTVIDRADGLYAWAKSLTPYADSDSHSNHNKHEPLPYIQAMVFATRVKVDAQMVQNYSYTTKAERERHFDRIRSGVDDLLEKLRSEVVAIVTGASLLEIALNFRLELETYVTQIIILQVSVRAASEPEAMVKGKGRAWNDELRKIRALFRPGTHSSSHSAFAPTILFGNAEQSVWWQNFIDQPLSSIPVESLRRSIELYELCMMLGAAHDRAGEIAAAYNLAPDYESTLFQLPSAKALCADFVSKLAAAIDVDPKRLHPVVGFESTSDGSDSSGVRGMRNAPVTAMAPIPPQLTHKYNGHLNRVHCIAVSADGKRVVSGSEDRTAKVWKATTDSREALAFKKHKCGVLCVALFPDGKRAASGGGINDKAVRIWDLDEGNEMQVLTEHEDRVWGVAVSPDGSKVASASQDKTIKLWDHDRGVCKATLVGHEHCVRCIAFSLDGQTLASGSEDKTIKTWSVNTRILERTIADGHDDVVRGIVFTPDGEHLVSCSYDKTIKVWKWRSGELSKTLEGHRDWVLSVAVFPDGERLVSGSTDNTIRIWNMRSGMLLHTLDELTSPVRSVAVSGDGRTLVSGSSDRSIQVWTMV